MKLIKFYIYSFLKYTFVALVLFNGFIVSASDVDGTIDTTYYSALLCTNDVCTTSTQINFKPTLGTPIHVVDTAITGNAWSETFGWINFNPTLGGVTNTTSGVLGGYAWGDGAGWINFAPTLGGVTINTSGQFIGWAWSENYGWIKFDCIVANACVTTDWRPASVRSSSSGGGSSGGYLPPKPIVVVPTVQPPTLPVSVTIVKKPVVKTPVVNKIPEAVSPTDENNFINPQPVEPPKITPSRKLISNFDNKEEPIVDKENSFVKAIGFIENKIFSRYFMGISFYYKIFDYKGYLNPFWAGVATIVILYFVYFLYKRRRMSRENHNIDQIQS